MARMWESGHELLDRTLVADTSLKRCEVFNIVPEFVKKCGVAWGSHQPAPHGRNTTSRVIGDSLWTPLRAPKTMIAVPG